MNKNFYICALNDLKSKSWKINFDEKNSKSTLNLKLKIQILDDRHKDKGKDEFLKWYVFDKKIYM